MRRFRGNPYSLERNEISFYQEGTAEWANHAWTTGEDPNENPNENREPKTRTGNPNENQESKTRIENHKYMC